MKIAVMGTGPFAIPTCNYLANQGYDIPLCVTRPVKQPPPKKMPPRPVFDWATAAGIPIYEPDSINSGEAIARLSEYGCDLFFVCDYGQILSSRCLVTARLGGINLHGSLLPRHRGAAPVQWTLLRGDAVAGVTVIHMTPKLDAGPTLSKVETTIGRDESAELLEPRLAEMGVQAVEDALSQLTAWDGSGEIGIRQDPDQSTRAPRFAKSDGQLDFRLSADYLVRLIKACQPWPGTFAELDWPNGKSMRVIVRSARSVYDVSLLPDLETASCGQVFSVATANLGFEDRCPWNVMLAVRTADGAVLIGDLQPAGKRAMSAEQFLRGHALAPGTCFQLPEPPLKELT